MSLKIPEDLSLNFYKYSLVSFRNIFQKLILKKTLIELQSTSTTYAATERRENQLFTMTHSASSLRKRQFLLLSVDKNSGSFNK